MPLFLQKGEGGSLLVKGEKHCPVNSWHGGTLWPSRATGNLGNGDYLSFFQCNFPSLTLLAITLFCSFRRDKKHADSEYRFITAKSNDISEDLNSVAFHCSSTTKPQGPREEELRLAKQERVVFVSAARSSYQTLHFSCSGARIIQRMINSTCGVYSNKMFPAAGAEIIR